MCMAASKEGCVLREELAAVKAATSTLDTRLTKVEQDVANMRSETQYGFRVLNEAVVNLGHDFGARMNNFDKRIIEEKEKWGTTLRTILLWTAKVILIGVLVAMGVNVVVKFMGR